MHASMRRVAGGLLTATLTATFLGALGTTSAIGATVASGSDFSVERAPGGYAVTLELDTPLPVKDDAPTLVVDGKDIGIATESLKGDTLTVLTSDPAVADASSVEAGWASRGASAKVERTGEVAQPEDLADPATLETLDANPASTGTYEYTQADYDFGTQSVALANIGGVRGEMQGRLYLPKTGGKRPVVLLLHGRHSTCYAEGSSSASLAWPCSGTRPLSIPSYAGYDGTGQALASHGYAVISISANAVNANDNPRSPDQGAQARGQLVLDTLSLLRKADAGQPVTLHDDARDLDVTLDDALQDPLTAADLQGRFDLSDVGLMGHSRGGEGITSAATLNAALDEPFGIKSLLPLAPVDFGRMTVPNVPLNVVLPYCDGDVSNQQGQHMLDDSRYAFDDDALRAGTWVMGANHNFFNTVWTPGKFPAGVSDDWGATSTNQTCGPVPAVAATSIRLSADAQYDLGTAYMAGWFRLTLGGEKQFLPMFDGSGTRPEVVGNADVRTVTTAPSSARSTLTSFESTSSLVRTSGLATAQPCASLTGRTIPAAAPACSTLASSQVPHWTPASNGGNVPATPVTRFTWTGDTGAVLVTVPKAKRDATGFDRLSLKVAADETVVTGTDLTLAVKDGSGATWSSKVSALNPYALVRLPAPSDSTTTVLKKIVLQQVNVPTSTLEDAGLDVSDVREVRLTAATGADATTTGAAYLSDLAWESSSLGTPTVKKENTVNVFAAAVEEGASAGTADVGVYLAQPATKPVVAYVSVLGSASGRAGIAMEKVTFAPGETCKVVTGSILGDSLASTSASTAVKVSAINTSGAVMGAKAFGYLTVREDDGVTGSATALPPVGAQGDPCEELARSTEVGAVTVDDPTPAPGGAVTLTASGYRSGEGVTFSLGSSTLGTAIADPSGKAVLSATVPADAAIGEATVKAVGAGYGLTSTGSLEVLTETSTALAIDPELPAINQPVTLTATVTGGDGGTVTFADGDTVLGTSVVEGGTATLAVPGFKAGSHELVASLAKTATAQASQSGAVSFTLTKGASTIALVMASAESTFGDALKGAVAVAGADEGTVTVTVAGTPVTVRLDAQGTGRFELPATLKVGSHTVSAVFDGTDEVEASGTATADVTVVKRATTTVTNATSSVKRSATYRVRATVSPTVAGVAPSGSVRVYVKAPGAKSFTWAKTVRLSGGTVVTTLKAPRTKGTLSVRTVYVGDGSFTGSTSATKGVRIR